MKKLAIVTVLSFLTSFSAFANSDKGEMWKNMTPDQRQKMATAHDKMAACLRSDRLLKDCHEEMMKSCESVMGKDACGIMGHHGKMMEEKEKSNY